MNDYVELKFTLSPNPGEDATDLLAECSVILVLKVLYRPIKV